MRCRFFTDTAVVIARGTGACRSFYFFVAVCSSLFSPIFACLGKLAFSSQGRLLLRIQLERKTEKGNMRVKITAQGAEATEKVGQTRVNRRGAPGKAHRQQSFSKARVLRGNYRHRCRQRARNDTNCLLTIPPTLGFSLASVALSTGSWSRCACDDDRGVGNS